MTAPTYQSTTVTDFGSDATTHAVSMPATVNSGDLLLAIAGFDAATTITTPAGWTLLNGPGSDTSGLQMASGVYGKVAAGTEGGTTVGFTTSNVQRGSVHVFRVTAWCGTLDGIISLMAAVSTVTAFDLGIGATARDILWIAAQLKSTSTTWASGSGTPTGYSNDNRTNISEDSTLSASIASATKAATAFTEYLTSVWLNISTGAPIVYLVGVLPTSYAVKAGAPGLINAGLVRA